LALGVFAYGLVFGMLAVQGGMGVGEAVAMSIFVFAGASQFVALDLWVEPLPVFALWITTFAVNLRHVLMSAALAPAYKGVAPLKKYLSMFFLVDESWALTMAEFSSGKKSASFLLVGGLLIFFAWNTATLTGALLGGAMPDPSRWGFDFAFTAMFIGLTTAMWRGTSDVPVLLVAGGAALAAEALLPGKWYILIGGVAGALAGVFSDGG
jgi:4-azaleucine resistance transporter AzlC